MAATGAAVADDKPTPGQLDMAHYFASGFPKVSEVTTETYSVVIEMENGSIMRVCPWCIVRWSEESLKSKSYRCYNCNRRLK